MSRYNSSIIRLIFFILIIPAGCHPSGEFNVDENPDLVDKKATRKTRALFLNLKNMAGQGILVGHQDDLAYGVGWKDQADRSDIKDVTGDYPAVFGWDISKLGQREFNIDTVDFEKMKEWIKQGFRWGGVATIGWHMDNPVTGGDSWDKTPAVFSILPGGIHHETYKSKLDLFAEFLDDLKVGLWTKIPIIFRPFHEHTGNWFWWGRGNTTAEEYKMLWKFTVEYLRDKKGIHHLLYAYSTDVFNSEEDYLEFYPGDDYVDIIAYDDYRNIRSAEARTEFVQRLKMLVCIARERNKIAALSETGLEKIPVNDWYTEVLLKGIMEDDETRQIAYVLLWRNANPGHHYAPFAGHSSEGDFLEFYRDPFTLFIKDLPDMYRLP
ncbi:MAG: beta-mannosidase [Cyclobacteriaceae bacterium]|nr:beta-mannosidase [Cyclobacteriaceae bacterium]